MLTGPGGRWLGKRGAAMVEFAMVMPVLVALLLGLGDVAPSTMAKFKSASATQSLADLVTQYTLAQTSDIVSAYAGAASVMAPFSTSTLMMRVTNVASDGNGRAFVYWSCGQGSLLPAAAGSTVTTLSNGDPVTNILYLTSGGKNTSYIVVDMLYTYTAPAQFVLPSPQTMTSVAYMLPRTATYVGFPWNGSTSSSPTAPAATTKSSSTTLSNGAVCNYAY